jgi:hypothetical protein
MTRLAVIESVLIFKRSNLMADAVKNWPQSSAQVAGSGVGWSWCDAPNYAAGSADRTRNVSETGEAMTGRRLGGEARGGPKRQMRFPSKKFSEPIFPHNFNFFTLKMAWPLEGHIESAPALREHGLCRARMHSSVTFLPLSSKTIDNLA